MKKIPFKKILLFVVLPVLFLGVGVLYQFVKPSVKEEGGGGREAVPTVPISTPRPIATPQPAEVTNTNKIEVGNVEVNNFYKDARVVSAEGDLILNTTSNDYTINYYPQNEMFNISITDSPFSVVRSLAESNFRSQMGVSQTELCKLNVIITTPRFANPEEAGNIYALSFCE